MANTRSFAALSLSLGVAIGTAGCTTPHGQFSERTEEHRREIDRWQEQMVQPRESRVRITDMPAIGERIELEKHRWLRDKRISLNVSKGAANITGHTIAQMLKDEGIQVMSSLPLDGYKYNGFGVSNVDGMTALRLLFGPMGLDFSVNDEGQYVAIVPNRSRTFYVRLGERTTTYESGSMSGNIGSGGGSSGGGDSAGAESGGTSAGVSTGLSTGSGTITVEGDFWGNIRQEIDERLTQCVPVARAPSPVLSNLNIPSLQQIMPQGDMGMMGGMGMGMGMGNPMAGGLPQPAAMPTEGAPQGMSGCVEQRIGSFSVNSSTGAIQVQAPHWLMSEVADYLDTVHSDNNVTLIYEGMLIAVTTSREKSEGIDLQGFATFANGQLGMAVTNNALGGVTVSPTGAVAPGAAAVGETFLGVQKLTGNPAQAFLAYLERNADYSISQRPRVAVTNGVPGEFAQYDTLYYNKVDQETSGGTDGSATVGTRNELVPFKIGNLLRIIPYYDSRTGMVRSPITFSQSVQTGEYESVQYLTGSGGNVESVVSRIPLIRDSNYSGEVLMRDGDMIILGGQITESSNSSGSGLPGYNRRNNPLSGLMGQKRHTDEVSTYYLALTLRVRN